MKKTTLLIIACAVLLLAAAVTAAVLLIPAKAGITDESADKLPNGASDGSAATLIDDPVDSAAAEKEEKYAKLQAENDAKALSALSKLCDRDFSQVGKYDRVYDSNGVSYKSVLSEGQKEIYVKMLEAMKSGKLSSDEVRTMILYLAADSDDLNGIYGEGSEYMQELDAIVKAMLANDPTLEHDIEVACDPQLYGS